MGAVDVGRRVVRRPDVVVGPDGTRTTLRSMVCSSRHRVHDGVALLDVETMTVEIEVPEDHPLSSYRPVRTPVWWGWRGEVGKRCSSPSHTGRPVVLRIEKQFSRFERALARLFRAPKEVRRPLDQMNSLIWELADGQHDFADIVQHLNDAFEEEATPVVERSTAAVRGFVALGVMKLVPEGGAVTWTTEPGQVPQEQSLEPKDPDMDQWS